MTLNMSWLFWMFTLIAPVLLLMPPPAAAERPPALTCTAEKQPDGSVLYRLSRATPPNCTTDWEDENKTAITHDSVIDPGRVLSHTNQSLVLKTCESYLHFERNCAGDWEEAHCQVSCSEPLKDNATLTVNQTRTCIFGNLCPSPLQVGGGIIGILLLAAFALVCLYLWRRFKHRRGAAAAVTTSYTSANDQIKIEMERMVPEQG